MPTQCLEHGCRTLVPKGRCPEHQKQHTTTLHTRYDATRPSAARRGYDHTWYRFLQGYRRGTDLDPTADDFGQQVDARNKCARCNSRTFLEYDHIIPLSQGGERLDPANVQPLCHDCHNAKTRTESKAQWNQ